jgi:hypothetical protein
LWRDEERRSVEGFERARERFPRDDADDADNNRQPPPSHG